MQGCTIGLRIDGNRAYTHLAAGANDAHCDFSTICNQDFFEHNRCSFQPSKGQKYEGLILLLPAVKQRRGEFTADRDRLRDWGIEALKIKKGPDGPWKQCPWRELLILIHGNTAGFFALS